MIVDKNDVKNLMTWSLGNGGNLKNGHGSLIARSPEDKDIVIH